MMENILPKLDRLGLSKDVLSGEVVVVTGSGRGIGREMACTFARLGAMVVIAELSEMGEGVQDEIRENGGDAAFFIGVCKAACFRTSTCKKWVQRKSWDEPGGVEASQYQPG
jgi:hypothetical protein